MEPAKPTHRSLLIIQPSAKISEEVMHLRERLHERIGNFSGRKVIPHITLFFADLHAEQETKLRNTIHEGCRWQRPFVLGYAGITHFPDQQTIYISPVQHEAIASVRNAIVASVKNDPVLGSHVHETVQPHLTIAAGLKDDQFKQAWQLLDPHSYIATDHVNEVVLMRRELRPGAVYEMIARHPLS
ncbi:MAG: 2'-5' RNA ligase family protein [Flavobacteriales bacterium]|nr:2'-5' RNA ligase family protein [Flavobacteriales bacterium]